MKKTFVMGWTALAVSLGGLVMISGCMVGPDYKPPKTAMPPSWSGPTNSTTNAGTRFSDNTANLAGWWTRFQDPKLTELVNAALRTNLDVRLAETLLRQARAARGIDAGGLWPSLTANRVRPPTPARSAAAPLPKPSARAREHCGIWIFLAAHGGRLEADDAAIQAACENVYGAQVTLVSEVALDYIQVRGAQEQIAIARTNLQTETHTAEITRQKGVAGFVSHWTRPTPTRRWLRRPLPSRCWKPRFNRIFSR